MYNAIAIEIQIVTIRSVFVNIVTNAVKSFICQSAVNFARSPVFRLPACLHEYVPTLIKVV